MRRLTLSVCAVLALACATPRPVLYPSATLERVGQEQAQRDVDECLALATRDAGGGSYSASQRVAKRTVANTAIGSATGAAVWAALGRNAARGAAGGAAGAATHTLLTAALYRRERGGVDPAFRHYVDRCLHDRGYDVIGWRAQ